jgi:hypothetical protein
MIETGKAREVPSQRGASNTKRWEIAVAGFLMQMALGAVYAGAYSGFRWQSNFTGRLRK